MSGWGGGGGYLALLDPVGGFTLDAVEDGTWTTALDNDLLVILLRKEPSHVIPKNVTF